MKKLIRLAALISALSLQPSAFAAGISGAKVETNGWVLDVYFSGWPTNISTNDLHFGWTSNNCPSSTNISLSYTSIAWDDSGNQITAARTNLATRWLRQTNAMNAKAGFYTNGTSGTVYCRTALAQPVFASDSSLTVTIFANTFSNNTTQTAIAVTNASTNIWPQCVAALQTPPWQIWTNAGNNLVEIMAAHISGQAGRPVRVITGTFTDKHSHSFTTNVTAMAPSPVAGPVAGGAYGLYEFNVPGSTFTAGDAISGEFSVWPWWGDTTSPLKTSAHTYVMPTPYFCTLTNYYDPWSGGLPGTNFNAVYAIADATNGSDATGQALSPQKWFAWLGGSGSVLPFATMDAALVHCMASNNTWYGRNDLSGAHGYFTNGTYVLLGGTALGDTVPQGLSWCELGPLPGVTPSNVMFSSAANSYDAADAKMHLNGWGSSNNLALFWYYSTYYWIDNCAINLTAAEPFSAKNPGYIWWTSNNFINFPQMAGYYSSSQFYPLEFRNNYGTFAVNGVFNAAGNQAVWTNAFGAVVFTDTTGAGTWPPAVGVVIYNNVMTGISNTAVALSLGASNIAGGLVANNLVEMIGTTETQPAIQIWAGDPNPANSVLTGLCFWHNTQVGARFNGFYNAYNTSNEPAFNNSIGKNILGGSENLKTDTYAGFTAASGLRTGNWPELYGVGYHGNDNQQMTGITAAGSFLPEFEGINVLYTNAVNGAAGDLSSGTTIGAGSFGFVNYQAWDGTVGGAGSGNYRYLSTSRVFVRHFPPLDDWAGLPYDITGSARSPRDPPGAYVDGQAWKGDILSFGQ